MNSGQRGSQSIMLRGVPYPPCAWALAPTLGVMVTITGCKSDPIVPDDNALLYVGAYGLNTPGDEGVCVFQFNTSDGGLTRVGAKAFGSKTSFVTGTNNKNRRVIYSADAVSDASKLKSNTTTGYVYAISVDAAGTMTELNHVESGGEGPAHVSVSPDESFVAVSNYGGGSVSIYPLNADGSLKPASDFHQYTGGSNVVSGSQSQSRMHSMTWVGQGVVLGADLGNDRVAQYKLDKASGKLAVNAANEFITCSPGSGPRHVTLHHTEAYVYILNELDNTIGVYTLDASSGSLSTTATQLISTLPANYANKSTSAEIRASDCGKFLYSSNRGHDSIAMFKIGADGQLTLLGHESSRGKTPRSIHVYKNFILVANQGSNNIAVFRIDETTGLLTYTNQSAECGKPVSLFIPRYQ